MHPWEPLLSYPTAKIVRIRNLKLGVLRWALLASVFGYIIFYQILFKGNHLNLAPVKGVHGFRLQHPTVSECDDFRLSCAPDFASMSTLEYCRQHNFTGTYQKPCEYWDAVSLMKRTTEGTLVPTRAMTFMQQRGCIPSEKNDWSCGGPLYQFMTSEHKTEEASDENSYARPIRDVFIADVDRFKLLLDHSAHSDAGVSAYSFEMAGQWLYCNDPDKGDEQCTRSPLICDETACPDVNQWERS